MIEVLLFLMTMGFASFVLSVLSPRWRFMFAMLSAFLFLTVAANINYIPVPYQFYENGVLFTGTRWIAEGQVYRDIFLGMAMVSFVWTIVLILDYIVGGRFIGGTAEEE
jgi:hypothetical protein